MLNWRTVLPRLLAAALLSVLGCLGAAQASAQTRACETDPTMIHCTIPECLAKQDAVKAPDSCSTPQSPLNKCSKISGCFNLRLARQRWLTCYVTRSAAMLCFEPPEMDHQIKAAEAITQVSACDAKIAEECECPWD